MKACQKAVGPAHHALPGATMDSKPESDTVTAQGCAVLTPVMADRRHGLRTLGKAALGALASGWAPAIWAQRPWVVAVVPQFRPEELHRVWVPLMAALERRLGQSIDLRIYPSIPAFEEELLKGVPDFAYMNPYHQVMANRAAGYIPLVRDREALSGILVVRKDDPIKEVRQLDGKRIAYPAPNAFGASLWMRALLAEQFKINTEASYVKTHSNAYRNALTGLTAAAGGVNKTLSEEPPEVRANLRVLFETPGVPPHPFSAHPRVPESVRTAVTSSLLQLVTQADLQALAQDVPWNRLERADYQRDYAPLARYGLDKYVVRN
jgi:phosphonate transport system substrate-binding protein